MINIDRADIDKSLLLKIIYDESNKPTVFMPNYGDFGPVIHWDERRKPLGL